VCVSRAGVVTPRVVVVVLQNFVGSRLARHVFARFLSLLASRTAEYLLTSVVACGSISRAGAVQLRCDVHAVLQVFQSFAGQASWVGIKTAFDELSETCESL
jgi:hypothetical protein